MTNETSDSGVDQRLSVSRRTVVKGAAWSVPAIMIASQAPAMAASPPVYIDFDNSTACKLPGGSFDFSPYCYIKGYVLWADFVNDTGVPVYVSVDSMVVGGVTQDVVGMTDPTQPCPAAPPAASTCMLVGTTGRTLGVFSNAATESANTDLLIKISWYDNANCSGTPLGTADLTGDLGGDPWTGNNPAGNPTGSCDFPPNTQCFKPPVTGRTC